MAQDSCANIQKCPMFPKFRTEALQKIFKAGYCEGRYENCERWKRSRAGQRVPPTLLPNGQTLTE